MPTVDELLKENTDLITRNYDQSKQIHTLTMRVIQLEKRVSELEAEVAELGSLKEAVRLQQEIINKLEQQFAGCMRQLELMQKQIDEMKH